MSEVQKPGRIQMEDATVEQLRDFANLVLGLDFDGRATAGSIRAKIAEAGYTLPYIMEQRAAPIPTVPNVGPGDVRETRTGRYGPERQINIPKQDKPGGQDSVQVRVNETLMLIPRGQWVWVPVDFIEVLNNAIEVIYPEYGTGSGPGGFDLGGLHDPQEVHSYPFSQR